MHKLCKFDMQYGRQDSENVVYFGNVVAKHILMLRMNVIFIDRLSIKTPQNTKERIHDGK